LDLENDELLLLRKRKQSLKVNLEAGTSSGNQSDRARTSPHFELLEAVGIDREARNTCRSRRSQNQECSNRSAPQERDGAIRDQELVDESEDNDELMKMTD
jgi:hypothetical protein